MDADRGYDRKDLKQSRTAVRRAIRSAPRSANAAMVTSEIARMSSGVSLRISTDHLFLWRDQRGIILPRVARTCISSLRLPPSEIYAMRILGPASPKIVYVVVKLVRLVRFLPLRRGLAFGARGDRHQGGAQGRHGRSARWRSMKRPGAQSCAGPRPSTIRELAENRPGPTGPGSRCPPDAGSR